MIIRFAASIESEIDEIRRHYDEQDPGRGDDFLERLFAALEYVEEDPWRCPFEETNPTSREIRRQLVRGYPYRVIFEPEDDAVLIVAVAHHSRRPGYWRHRR